MKKHKPDLETIGRVLKQEWQLSDAQLADVLTTFFFQGARL
jgi:hypothetical protein